MTITFIHYRFDKAFNRTSAWCIELLTWERYAIFTDELQPTEEEALEHIKNNDYASMESNKGIDYEKSFK